MRLENFGSEEQILELRQLLDAAGYNEPAVCRRLGLKRLAEFQLDAEKREPLAPPVEPIDILIRLFLAGEYVSRSLASDLLKPEGLSVLERNGFLHSGGPDDHCFGPVAVYPVAGLYIASDRWSNPNAAPFETPDDAVYPAFIRTTRHFLELLPNGACENLLDLCAGTGIAALVAAKNGARQAWSSDITERCSIFAEFNRRLNAIPNLSVVTSDLYQSLNGQTFDRIVAHPPYVPSLSPKWIFYSGGEDGEQVTRGIVEGLPRHLRDGGTFCCVTMGTDRTGRPLEWRLRDWLGDAESQFDIALFVVWSMDPETFSMRSSPLEVRGQMEVQAWREQFKRLGVESLAHGLIVIRRRNNAQRTFTIRRHAGTSIARAQWEWLTNWQTAATSAAMPGVVLDSPLHRGPGAELKVTHRIVGDTWETDGFRLRTERPLPFECEAQPWMAHLISLCDGVSTGRQFYTTLIENGSIPSDAPLEEFAEALASLVSAGFVEVEGFRSPQATE